MTTDFFTLILHPAPSNTYHKGPKRIPGFLTEKDAWDFFNNAYNNSRRHFWENPGVVSEPLADPKNPDQL